MSQEQEENQQRAHEVWAQELRRKVEEGIDQADRGELLDADEVFREIEARLAPPPAGPSCRDGRAVTETSRAVHRGSCLRRE